MKKNLRVRAFQSCTGISKIRRFGLHTAVWKIFLQKMINFDRNLAYFCPKFLQNVSIVFTNLNSQCQNVRMSKNLRLHSFQPHIEICKIWWFPLTYSRLKNIFCKNGQFCTKFQKFAKKIRFFLIFCEKRFRVSGFQEQKWCLYSYYI